MYDLFLDLMRRADLSLASAALLVILFGLSRQRYRDLVAVQDEHGKKLDRIEKTFIREGITLYEKED